MKQVKITFIESLFKELKEALRWDGKERAAYVLCKSTISEARAKLIPHKVIALKERDYKERSAGHYSITKKKVDEAFNEAIKTQSDIIQCHVHPWDPAKFSGIDDHDEPKFMRHVAEGIRGIIHASMVFGKSLDTVDAWFYDRDAGDVRPVQKVVVIKNGGIDIYVPQRSPLKHKVKSIDSSRTQQAFGKKAVEKLSLLDAAVLGASGIGAPIIEMIARDNYNSVTIADPDTIEASNLNRLPGTREADIGKNKAEHYAEYAKIINPGIDAYAYPESFYEPKVQKAFGWADIVFGAVDSAARLSLNRACLASLTPYFDFGAGIVAGESAPEAVGGQIYSVIPGRENCLACAEIFKRLETDFLDPETRAIEERQGYIKGAKTDAPLVMFLDYFVAGLGYYKALRYVWGTGGEADFSLHIDAQARLFMEAGTASKGCIWCQRTGYLGKGDEVPTLVPPKKAERPAPSIVKLLAKRKARSGQRRLFYSPGNGGKEEGNVKEREETMKIYRQGDVTLRKIEGLPATAVGKTEGDGVIAKGESTGHRHWIDPGKGRLYEDMQGQVYLEVVEDTVIIHSGPENVAPRSRSEAREQDLHMPITIGPGMYQVTYERVHDPYNWMDARADD